MAELVCYRASSYRTAVRTRRHGDDSEGRYHEPGAEPTQYLSLHPLTPWAEVARAQGCRTLDDALEIRVAIWALRVRIDDAPAVVDFDAAEHGRAAGPISAAGLVADDWGECQALARAHRLDPGAPKTIRVPSAALAGTENLVIFGPRRMVRYEAEPLRPLHLPAALAAVDGRAPQGVWPLVRTAGEPHAGLEAWARGESYRLPAISTDPL